MKPVYLTLTEDLNAYDYLEHTYDAILQVDRSKLAWKWAIIGLHGALYAYMICALVGSNYERVTQKSKRGNSLIPFDEALKRCQMDRRMHFYTYSNTLLLSPKQEKSIRIIQRVLRNNFIHFIPKIWVIEINGLADVCIDILEVIRFLAIDCGNVFYRKEVTRTKTASMIRKSINALKKNRLYLETHRKDN